MSKVAHLVRNGFFNGGISEDSSEKDAKYATRKNWEINGTTKLLTLTSDYLHCLLRDKDSLHKFKAGFHNSLWTAKLVRENMYSYAISLTSFNKAGKEFKTPFNWGGKGFRISDPIQRGRKKVQNF